MATESRLTEGSVSELPDALSLCGKGVILYVDQQTSDLVIVPTRCHRWDCPNCGPDRVTAAKADARAGRPRRLITLTLKPLEGRSLPDFVDFIRLSWRRLVQRIRRNFGPFEWMAVLELTHRGTPHLHILTRGEYIPQKWLSRAWLQLSGAYVVHIRKIDNLPGAVNEVTNYLTKSANQVQEACPGRPVYTMSRSWLPDDYKANRVYDPPDPNARCFHVKLRDALFLVEQLGATVHSHPSLRCHWVVTWPHPPDWHLPEGMVSTLPWQHLSLIAHIMSSYQPGGFDPVDYQETLDFFACERWGEIVERHVSVYTPPSPLEDYSRVQGDAAASLVRYPSP